MFRFRKRHSHDRSWFYATVSNPGDADPNISVSDDTDSDSTDPGVTDSGVADSRRTHRGGSLQSLLLQWVTRTASRTSDIALRQRERWSLWTVPLFGLGIGLYFSLAVEPTWSATAAAIALLAIVRRQITVQWQANDQRTDIGPWQTACLILTPVLSALLVMAAGFAIAQWRTARVAAPILLEPIRQAVITGRVERLEQRADQNRAHHGVGTHGRAT